MRVLTQRCPYPLAPAATTLPPPSITCRKSISILYHFKKETLNTQLRLCRWAPDENKVLFSLSFPPIRDRVIITLIQPTIDCSFMCKVLSVLKVLSHQVRDKLWAAAHNTIQKTAQHYWIKWLFYKQKGRKLILLNRGYQSDVIHVSYVYYLNPSNRGLVSPLHNQTWPLVQ
jgi:hypothetical protein